MTYVRRTPVRCSCTPCMSYSVNSAQPENKLKELSISTIRIYMQKRTKKHNFRPASIRNDLPYDQRDIKLSIWMCS